MNRRALAVPLVMVAGLAGAGTATAAGPPMATASGSDAPPPLPSLVQTRLNRVDRALDRLTDDVNDTDSAHAAKSGKVVRRQLAAAWRGAKYYVVHAPVAPPEDRSARSGVRVKSLKPRLRAKISQDDAGPVIADPVTTAMAVFDEFHNVSSTIVELTDGARVPVLDAMSRTLFLALDRRDKAIADVQALAPPAPPVEDRRVVAHAAQEEGAATFDTSMPLLTPWLDDEIQHVDGLLSDAPDLRPGGRRILTKARAHIVATEATIATLWPPAPAD
jgi:hypothetical protein